MLVSEKDYKLYGVVRYVVRHRINAIERKEHKRHWLNDYLSFGLKKEDAESVPLVEYASRDLIALDLYQWWMTNKLSGYILVAGTEF